MVGEEYPIDNRFEEDIEDLEEDQLEEDLERQKDLQESVYDETPSYEKKEDLYSLFWKVVKTQDSSKVGNVGKAELGLLDISVRDAQRIQLLGHVLGHTGFGKFFGSHGEITLSTSASKDGWLPELFVSTKATKTKKRDSNLPQLRPPQKKGLFKR